MAGLGQRFDATQHDTEQRGDYAELPNGVYDLEITESDVSPTKNGSGTILKVTNDVLAPEEFKGRKLFNNYNLENQNAQAQEIGQRQFASLCRAIGVSEVEDSEDLHFKRYRVKVGLGKPQYEKNGKNEIVKDSNGEPVVKYPASAEIKRYFFPDEGDMPDVGAEAPVVGKPANDNRPATANDNRQAPATTATAGGAKKRPWGK